MGQMLRGLPLTNHFFLIICFLLKSFGNDTHPLGQLIMDLLYGIGDKMRNFCPL